MAPQKSRDSQLSIGDQIVAIGEAFDAFMTMFKFLTKIYKKHTFQTKLFEGLNNEFYVLRSKIPNNLVPQI